VTCRDRICASDSNKVKAVLIYLRLSPVGMLLDSQDSASKQSVSIREKREDSSMRHAGNIQEYHDAICHLFCGYGNIQLLQYWSYEKRFKQPSQQFSFYTTEAYCTICGRLVLWPYTTGTLSIAGDAFQSGYRWFSVRWNGPAVAQNLWKRVGMSFGLTASLASSSETGM